MIESTQKAEQVIMQMDIPEDVAQRLIERARQQGSTVGELLRTLMNLADQDEKPSGTLAQMAQNAREAGIASDEPVDTAGRSREILNTEYADYLKKRMDSDDNHHG